jgi:Rieske Fe-S protein
MNRKEFLLNCGLCILTSCAGTKYVSAPIEGDSLLIPLQSFLDKKYIVAHNDQLEYPICIYKFSENDYKALWMKCTHQGTELQVFGDRLQCPAHGSEFTNTGEVQNGPADMPLRTFNVSVSDNGIKVKLS